MTSTPNKVASVVSSLNFEGYYDWSSVDANRIAVAGDGLNISGTSGASYNTYVLRAKGFGFSIPSNAIISRVGVYLTKRASQAGAIEALIQLVGPGEGAAARIGSNMAISDVWPTSFSQYSYYWTGGDLSGVTAAVVNSADFGLDIRVSATTGFPSVYVDALEMWVEYSLPISIGDASINKTTMLVGTSNNGLVAQLSVPVVGGRNLNLSELQISPVNFDISGGSSDRRGLISGSYNSYGGSAPSILNLIWQDFITSQPIKSSDAGRTFTFDLIMTAPEAVNSPKSQRFSLEVVEGSPVTIVGTTTGTTSAAAISGTLAGDIQIVFAYRDGNNALPTLPAGWTSVAAPTGVSTNSMRIGYRIAGATNSNSGTWTSSTSVVMLTLRPREGYTIAIGNMTIGSGATNSFSYPNVTATDAKSLILLFAGHRSTNQPLETPPSSGLFQNLVTLADATDEIAVHYAPYIPSGGTIIPGTVTMTGTASGWFTASLEIRATATTVVTGRRRSTWISLID